MSLVRPEDGQIRQAADQLAAEQSQRVATSERLEKLVDELEGVLDSTNGAQRLARHVAL